MQFYLTVCGEKNILPNLTNSRSRFFLAPGNRSRNRTRSKKNTRSQSRLKKKVRSRSRIYVYNTYTVQFFFLSSVFIFLSFLTIPLMTPRCMAACRTDPSSSLTVTAPSTNPPLHVPSTPITWESIFRGT